MFLASVRHAEIDKGKKTKTIPNHVRTNNKKDENNINTQKFRCNGQNTDWNILHFSSKQHNNNNNNNNNNEYLSACKALAIKIQVH